MSPPVDHPSDHFTETTCLDKKSLRVVEGKSADWTELAKDCVCFANGRGGILVIGIEDGASSPPEGQRIDAGLLERISKRIKELTVNVSVEPEKETHKNGGEYIRLHIQRSKSVASTSDGRYFLRIGDDCQPIVGDDVLRLADERSGTPWEGMTSLQESAATLSGESISALCERLRKSDRVKPSVKEKSDQELLQHYELAQGETLTNLGILMLGSPRQRRKLGSAPLIQVIKYDDQRQKVAKWIWEDQDRAPHELVDAVWTEIPDFRESYELPDGMFRTKVPAFDEVVVREALVNALVHRPYTQRGDIFLNLHPDGLEIVNPGRLPLGVTPKNILHASRRRNLALARLFHDLGLMEREGSGIDLMFERLLIAGKGTPTITEGTDSVHVTVPRRIVHPAVIALLTALNERYQLSQRERIAVALLAQNEGLTAVELSERLELENPASVRAWIDRPLSWGVLVQTGKGKGMRYLVRPELLRGAGLDESTTLQAVEPHRLRALILEDLKRYPGSGRSDIHRRIGAEIPSRQVRRMLDSLRTEGVIAMTGERRWAVYSLAGGTLV